MEIDSIKDELLSIIDTAIKSSSSLDNKAEFEIYLYYGNISEVEINEGIMNGNNGIVTGHFIRVARGSSGHKRLTSASSSTIEPEKIKTTIKESLRSLNTIEIEDPHFHCFCESKETGKEGILNNEIIEQRTSDLMKMVNQVDKSAKAFDSRIASIFGSYINIWRAFAVGNSNGVQKASRTAFNNCFFECIANDGTDRRSVYDFETHRDQIIDEEQFATQIARKAVSLLNGKKLNKKAVLPVVLDNVAAAGYISSSIGLNANGQQVHEKTSALADKMGEKISIPEITIIDDGQNPISPRTDSIDAEGHPQQKTHLITKGVLKQFMLNTYYSNIMDSETTGNCGKVGYSTLEYENPILIETKNLKLIPGNKSEDEIISSLDGEAVYITGMPLGGFGIDPTNFSSVASSAFLIKNGEIKYPLQPITIAGNRWEGLKSVLAIGNNPKMSVGRNLIETPSLAFEGFMVSG